MGAGNVDCSAADKNKKIYLIPNILTCGLLIFIILFTGCLDNLTQLPTTYEAHPTTISYILEYGYEVECLGPGRYDITYRCDYPDVLSGTVLPVLLYTSEAKSTIVANNRNSFSISFRLVISWPIQKISVIFFFLS